MSMSQFYMVGTNYLLKKVYYDGNGHWTTDKSKAKVFSVADMSQEVRHSAVSKEIMHIKIEWKD